MRYFCSFLLLIFALLFVGQPAPAQSQCINDRSGGKGAANEDIAKSLELSVSPLTLSFSQSRNPGPSPSKSKTASGICATCLNTHPTEKSARNLVSWSKELFPRQTPPATTKKIKKECIEASLQRELIGDGYSCLTQKPKKFEYSGSSIPCLNQKSVDYIHFAVNEALNCLSTERTAIDPRFILKKFNNETGFNFFLAYSGGKGIGQLTSDPVDDIAGWRSANGKFNVGNARYILQDLVKSKNPACKPFIETIKNDLDMPPPSPAKEANYCHWVSPGDGLARNLVYSLGYYVYVRDKIVQPAVSRLAPRMGLNNNIINYITLVAYGPGGPAAAKALIRRIRLNDRMPPAQVKEKVIKLSSYVRQTEEKMDELLAKLNTNANANANANTNPTDAERRGDSCIQ